MRIKHFMIIAALAACNHTSPDQAAPRVAVAPGNKLFLDVHELGKGPIDRAAIAGAHAKDLATQGKYGVDYKAYWVDETQGKIYCLVEAPTAAAASAVHKEAHGLVAQQVIEVTPGK